MRPRVGLIIGYFDWFSGYQETALAASLAKYADVEVIAGDKVSPSFTDAHLRTLGHERTYAPIDRDSQHGVRVTRLPVREIRSMVWSRQVGETLRAREFDLLIQVMPGQGLSIAPSRYRTPAPRIALYGDNSAMWSALPRWKQRIKWWVFAISKGSVYRYVNRHAVAMYGYTPETLERLSRFGAGAESHVMALTYRPEEFAPDDSLRAEWRTRLGVTDSEVLIVTAGKQQPYKRLEDLLSAVSRLVEAHPQVRLALAGSDHSEYSEGLRQQVDDDHRLRDKVAFLPFLNRSELNGFLNAGDVGAWPHLPAITIQQALGTGLFVVLPKNEQVGHLLVDDHVGGYFPVRAGDGLLTALENSVNVDVSPTARRARADRNAWLSADELARVLLDRHLDRSCWDVGEVLDE